MAKNRIAAVVLGLAVLAVMAGCAGKTESPKVASINATGAVHPSAGVSASGERPRHRVDESIEDRNRLIAPWKKCLKDHGADIDTQPGTIKGAEQWSRDHASAGRACEDLLPQSPWGEDRANPAYRDNIHAWVKCMNDKGMKVVETPDNAESPWRFSSDQQPSNSDEIEIGCEKSAIGKFDK